MVRLLHLPYGDGEALRQALAARMSDLSPNLRRSATWNRGTEMTRRPSFTRTVDASVYFCDSHSPWQRGSNENNNGLLSDYFHKASDLGVHTLEHLLAMENELTNRPRMATARSTNCSPRC